MRIDPIGRELEKSGRATGEKYWPTTTSRATMREVGSRRQRRIDRAAVAGLVPLVAVVPIFLLAMVPFWWIISRFLTIGYLPTVGLYVLAGGLLFVPVVQRRILTRLIGARRPTRDEAPRLQAAFDEVTQALHIRDHRFAVGVIDSDELNAFACGGHLVVVTSFAARELDHDALCGVLAHEFCHHLGSHTVTLTVQQWLLVPVDALARIGGFLDNVAVAAASTFGAKSRPVAVVGRLVAPVFRALAWFFALGRSVSSALSNLVGRAAEFRADQRVVTMGYGRQLASALRRTVATSSRVTSRGHSTLWTRVQESHPPARTRIARLEATLRRRDLR
jgi:Zn-dependent protease with chaperone function